MAAELHMKHSTSAKYNNIKVQIDEFVFDSQKEAKRYTELNLLQRAGKISELQLQVRFEIIPKQEEERACYYVADFVYVENGKKIAEDVKSSATKTAAYIIKKKLFKKIYKEYEFREIN